MRGEIAESYGPELQLDGYVLYRELCDIMGLPEGCHRFGNRFETRKIGSVLYVKTENIVDPIVLAAVQQCTNLSNLTPIAELLLEVAPYSKVRRDSLRKEFEAEGRLHTIANTIFIQLGLSAAAVVNNQDFIANAYDVLDDEDEDDYEATVIATQRIRIGYYT